ncbi:response regulator [Striga asiatica]|uniref:Response regulator n=1 Tax=Striga asiatica TaxID=4170 RepID=A0A5A7PSD3_STRAF|nr:response regulator [Striga asiatica]
MAILSAFDFAALIEFVASTYNGLGKSRVPFNGFRLFTQRDGFIVFEQMSWMSFCVTLSILSGSVEVLSDRFRSMKVSVIALRKYDDGIVECRLFVARLQVTVTDYRRLRGRRFIPDLQLFHRYNPTAPNAVVQCITRASFAIENDTVFE